MEVKNLEIQRILRESSEVLSSFRKELESCKDLETLEKIRVKYLGKKSWVQENTKVIGLIQDLESRKSLGEVLNTIKETFQREIENKKVELGKLVVERIDYTFPHRSFEAGEIHILTRVLREILTIFSGMGFEVEEGPEVEWDYYNFEALNIPKFHPARETQSTFFITDEMLLRTHTSPVQIRVMEKKKPPLRFVAPGRVYRFDPFDSSHAPCFYQMEGLYVDREVTFSELKGTLEIFVKRFFGPETPMKFVPSYFPFTEPSAEVHILWRDGKGNERWLEVLGCGMVHPNVFKSVGLDPREWKGYAFGFGIERLAMVKYGISDIRWFSENDLRFLKGNLL